MGKGDLNSNANTYLSKEDKRKILIKSLLVFLIPLITIAIFTIVLLRVKDKSDLQAYLSLEEHIVDVQQEHIQEDLFHFANDLLLLSTNKNLEKLWEESTKEEALNELQNDFLELSNYRRLYDQIRLIDSSGMEIIRVNFNNGFPEVVTKEQLQNKKHRYYFTDAFVLNKNEFFFSPLDLNIENGEIEQPLKPMIRIATPIFDKNGTKQGIVLINCFGKNIVKKTLQHTNPLINSQLMLLNSDGYYLKSIDPEKEWCFMFDDKKDINFAEDHPDSWKLIKNIDMSQMETNDGIYSFKTIYPIEKKYVIKHSVGSNHPLNDVKYFPKDYSWKIVSYIPANELYNNRNTRWFIAIILLIALALILIYISVKYYRTTSFKLVSEQALIDANARFNTTLNSIDAGIYVADIDTYEILFANKYIKDIYGNVLGKYCYVAIQQNHEGPCPFCTNKLLIDDNGNPTKPHIWEFHNTQKNKWFQIHDQAIHWTDNRIVRLAIMFDVTERRDIEEALRKSERRLKEAQETAHIGHWELDLINNKLLWSDEVYRIFNVIPEEYTPTLESFIDKIHPDDKERVTKAYQDSLENKSDYNIIHKILLSNGKIKHVNEKCYHLYNNEGNAISSFGTVTDITDLVEKEQKITKQKDELIALNANKDKFFSIISHDLRSPLGSIFQLIRIIHKNAEDYSKTQIKKHLATLLKSSKKIFGLLENLLEWSKVQTNSVNIRITTLHIKHLVENTVELLENSAQNKSISISVNIDEDYRVNADEEMVNTILRNLISNAIKFTPLYGTIDISANPKTLNDSDAFLEIKVKDSGIGMTEEEAGNLFKIEKSKSAKGTEGESGSGLGLILCQELVHKNGGEIYVSSKKDEGTEFRFTLPVAEPGI